MKIIQIIPHLGSGGGERFVVDLSNELAERGHEVILCTLLTLEGDLGFYVPQVSSRVRLVSLNKGLGLSFAAMWNFAKLVKREMPDVIHSHLNTPPYIALAELFLCKGVHTVHNDAQKEASDRINQIARKLLFKLKRSIPVTISAESHRSFVEFYGFDAPLVYNGRNVSPNMEVSEGVKQEFKEYRRTENTRCIVQLARFEPQKRIPMMARVATRLSKDGYDFCILNIGIPSNLQEYNEVMHSKPSCQYILGQKSNPLEYLKEAGAYALSSSFEGLPISLIEALGVGAIPICTPAGGIVDLVENGVNGILASDLEEESFYEAMKRYLSMTEVELEQMRQKAQQSYEPYSMTKCAGEYINLYEQIRDQNQNHSTIT